MDLARFVVRRRKRPVLTMGVDDYYCSVGFGKLLNCHRIGVGFSESSNSRGHYVLGHEDLRVKRNCYVWTRRERADHHSIHSESKSFGDLQGRSYLCSLTRMRRSSREMKSSLSKFA